ncbi:328_t:CDS:2, partial [Entrophospora sp. SA101]
SGLEIPAELIEVTSRTSGLQVPTIPATESSLIHFMTLEEQITRLAEDYKKRSGQFTPS